MSKTLELVFQNASGKEVVLRLPEPKDGLTKAAADAVMQEIISRNIFTSKTGELAKSVEARIRSSDAVVLA